MANINKYIKALLHPAGGHQGTHKAHQAGNLIQVDLALMKFCGTHLRPFLLKIPIRKMSFNICIISVIFPGANLLKEATGLCCICQ